MTDEQDAPMPLVPTRVPEGDPGPSLVLTRRQAVIEHLKTPRLYWSIAAMFGSIAVTLALVIAYSSWRSEHGARLRSDAKVTHLQTELDHANNQLSKANSFAVSTAKEANCRAALGNSVSDAQAQAVLAIGDVALARVLGPEAAYRAAGRYEVAKMAYLQAVRVRAKEIPSCARHGS